MKAPTEKQALRCPLCGHDRPLIQSHIYPNFFLRGALSSIVTGTKGNTQPASILISTLPGVESGQRQGGDHEIELGMWERLLYAVCDWKIGHYESYFRNFFYGRQKGLKKKPVGEVVALSSNERTVTVEYASMKLFVLSLLWRASVAKGLFFRKISLDEEQERSLAEALRTQSAGPRDFFGFAMADLHLGGMEIEDFLEEPDVIYESGIQCCRFIAGGFMILVSTSRPGETMPGAVREWGLRESGNMGLLRVDDLARQSGWLDRVKKTGALPVIAP